jgi:uncharacterized RDD family membrane protein YckC
VTQYGPQYQQPGQPPPPAYPPGYQAPVGYRPPLPLTAPNGLPLADFGVRLGARLIDGLIAGAIALIVIVPLTFGVLIASRATNSGQVDAAAFVFAIVLLNVVAALLGLLVSYVYEVEMTKRTGQTIGKKILKLRVAPLDPARPVDRGVMARRWLVYGPGSWVPGLGLVDGLWQLWDQPYKQCLHDKFARTVVVKVPG